MNHKKVHRLYYLVSIIFRPIIATSSVISGIADGGLTIRCSPNGKDEIASMQHAVNAMVEAKIHSEKAEIAKTQAEEAQLNAVKAHNQGRLAAADQLKGLVHNLTDASSELT